MRIIRPVTDEEVGAFTTISANAYPGIELFSSENRERFQKRMEAMQQHADTALFALFEDGEMRLYDFTMNLLSTRTLVGGVAVDLLHKKEKIAADMLQFFLAHYKEKGACLTALYPFRPDFYLNMGFGYGTKRNLSTRAYMFWYLYSMKIPKNFCSGPYSVYDRPNCLRDNPKHISLF